MDKIKNRAYIYEFNNLNNQCNFIYHSAAQRIGISDCALAIFFVLCDAEKKYTQSDLCDAVCLRRQTVNSALKKMKSDGYITLVRAEQKTGKYIELTEMGREFIDLNVMPMLRAEEAVCEKLTDEQKLNFLYTYGLIIRYLKAEHEKNTEKK